MTPTLHAAAWAICETSGPRCEELCPGCLEQARAAGKVWLEAAKKIADQDAKGAWMAYTRGFYKPPGAAAAIEALIGETTA